MVFVLDANKKPLSPCHEAVARKLLKQGKATIFRRYPFTIILKKSVEDTKNKQEYRLKIDYGSKHTGLAILQNNNVSFFIKISGGAYEEIKQGCALPRKSHCRVAL